MNDGQIEVLVDDRIEALQLPTEYRQLVMNYLLPLAKNLESQRRQKATPLVLGVNGAQGTGKSTLCEFLKMLLEVNHQQRCVVLSIDDLYLSKADRLALGESVHPLLATRGVPGTHDVQRGIQIIEDLKQGLPTVMPAFDKADDDLLEQSQWHSVDGHVDIILFEGWCVGAIPQQDHELQRSCNRLERDEDPTGAWRTYVNHCLMSDYQRLFAHIDRLLMLKAPSMDSVLEWRTLQERKLAEKQSAKNKSGSSIMNEEGIQRFIQHYERLTRWMWHEMPNRADYVFNLSESHVVYSVSGLIRSQS